MPPTFSQRNRQKQPLIIRVFGPVIIIILAIYVGLSSAMKVSRDVIEQHLQTLSALIERQAAAAGKEGKLTYGDITFEGFGFDKHAVISNVSISIAENVVTYNNKWSLSTSAIHIAPDAFLDSKFFISLPAPINIIQNSELKYVVSYPTHPKLAYFDGVKGTSQIIEQSLSLPEKIIISPAQSVDDSGVSKSGSVEISYAPMPLLKSSQNNAEKHRDYDIEIKDLKIAGDEGVRLTAGAISSHYSESQVDEGKISGKYILSLTDLLVFGGESITHPYSIHADFDINSQSGVDDINIEKLSLIGSDFDLSLSGKVMSASDDPLLFGSAKLAVNNAGRFISSELIPQVAKGTIAMALQKLSGSPLEPNTHLELPLKREKNSQFYIGDTSFESLAAAVFNDMMQQQNEDKAPDAARDTSPVPSTLPDAPPSAANGAAPYSPVISAPVEELKAPSAADSFRSAAPPEKTVGDE